MYNCAKPYKISIANLEGKGTSVKIVLRNFA